jgi:hypothetical protein
MVQLGVSLHLGRTVFIHVLPGQALLLLSESAKQAGEHVAVARATGVLACMLRRSLQVFFLAVAASGVRTTVSF